MVLDDLGLVPTLRRAARDRGRKAGVAVEFESMGADRRLPMDLESGLFRILDDALIGYLEAGAEKLSFKLDWAADQLEAHMIGTRAEVAPKVAPPEPAAKDLPPALAAMMEERRVDAASAAEAARRQSIVALPPTSWREIQNRAETVGVIVELSPDGEELRLVTELPDAGRQGDGT